MKTSVTSFWIDTKVSLAEMAMDDVIIPTSKFDLPLLYLFTRFTLTMATICVWHDTDLSCEVNHFYCVGKKRLNSNKAVCEQMDLPKSEKLQNGVGVLIPNLNFILIFVITHVKNSIEMTQEFEKWTVLHIEISYTAKIFQGKPRWHKSFRYTLSP